jgi:trehalose 6-phosphate phosphatase
MTISVKERVWIFDFDGTLAPLVPERDKAVLHGESLKLLNYLITAPGQKVAILSSRMLDDLIPRVPVEGIFLGGGSGTEWLVPGGKRMTFCKLRKLKEARSALLASLEKMAADCGADLEDKKWSVALHTRRASPEGKQELHRLIAAWQGAERVGIFKGPEVIEVLFFPEVNKAFGVRTLCTLLKLSASNGAIVYSGDDENDAMAMEFVTGMGGIAITIGDRPLVPSSLVVKDQPALAVAVRGIATMDNGNNAV